MSAVCWSQALFYEDISSAKDRALRFIFFEGPNQRLSTLVSCDRPRMWLVNSVTALYAAHHVPETPGREFDSLSKRGRILPMTRWPFSISSKWWTSRQR